jgi:RNA polymerase-binding transcription factor DksA
LRGERTPAGLVQHPPDPAEDEPGYDARTHDALTDALRRLHGPDFGRCRGCEAEIPFERLVAKPQTTRCCCCETAIEHSA